MQIEELMKRIRLLEEAGKAVRKQSIPEREYEAWKDMFNRDLKEFMEKWSVRPDRYVWALEFCLRLAAEVYEVYCEKGISDKIFDDTFYDITIWCQECMRKYGICGMEETGWIAQSLKMNLFRLGRLQFEPLHGKLNVHIPAGEPLSYESCMDSFRQAEEFFGKHQTYVCDSWLLSPHLKEILPGDKQYYPVSESI